jgi:hypothetical protein
MPTHRGVGFDSLTFPRRRTRLQGAARDQLSSDIGRRWSRSLIVRSGQVPVMLDQAAPCEGVCEIRRVIIEWTWRTIKVGVRTMTLGGVVIPVYDFSNSHDFNS